MHFSELKLNMSRMSSWTSNESEVRVGAVLMGTLRGFLSA